MPQDVYAWPGGYPIVYYGREDNAILCPACAGPDDIPAIYFEGPPICCEECGAAVDSAYGDPERS